MTPQHGEIRNDHTLKSRNRFHRVCERFCHQCGWELLAGTADMVEWIKIHTRHDPDFEISPPLPAAASPVAPLIPLPIAVARPSLPPWYEDFMLWLQKRGNDPRFTRR